MALHRITATIQIFALAVCLPATCLASGNVAAGSVGEVRQYDVYRGDRPIGTHTVRRSHRNGLLLVEAKTRIQVRLLGIELYRFVYDARETWDETGLLELAVSLDDDGRQVRLEGRREGAYFEWSDGSATRSHPMPVYPTNHWNADVLGQEAVLNTLTGQINRVTIREDGEDRLALADTSIPARRYRYDGQLQLLSWYDPAGRWLAMHFTLDDGTTIRYLCSDCSEQERL